MQDASALDAAASVDAHGSERASATAAVINGLLLRGARLPGGAEVDVVIRDGRISAILPAGSEAAKDAPAEVTLELSGRWIVPGFIDSHVHLSYLPASEALLRAGVVAAVDLAAPEAALARVSGPLRLIGSGPMITSRGGYPLDSWGSDGYGVAVATAEEGIAAVDRLVAAGARVIKLPIGQGKPLPEAVVRAAIARAHEHGLKVAVHALTDAAAAQGARLGADVLAHTPVETLAPSTVEAWRGRAVISTLSAFGGAASTIANLRALRAGGVAVLYGTDLGNTQDARIDPKELALLGRAGVTGSDLLEAATSAPAQLWGWDDLGSIAPGKAANILVVAADPTVEAATLAAAVHVIVEGKVLQ